MPKRTNETNEEGSGRFDMLGGLRPRFVPNARELAEAQPYLHLRTAGRLQWSPYVERGASCIVCEHPGELFLAFGSNMTRRCVWILAFDQASTRPPQAAQRAVHAAGPVGPLAPYSLDLPRGSRRFDFGIVLFVSADPQKFVAPASADATYQFAYLEDS